jgi:hypothetical protein
MNSSSRDGSPTKLNPRTARKPYNDTACEWCRRSHRDCEGKFPDCINCKTAGRKCIRPLDTKTSGEARSACQAMEQRCEQLEDRVRCLEDQRGGQLEDRVRCLEEVLRLIVHSGLPTNAGRSTGISLTDNAPTNYGSKDGDALNQARKLRPFVQRAVDQQVGPALWGMFSGPGEQFTTSHANVPSSDAPHRTQEAWTSFSQAPSSIQQFAPANMPVLSNAPHRTQEAWTSSSQAPSSVQQFTPPAKIPVLFDAPRQTQEGWTSSSQYPYNSAASSSSFQQIPPLASETVSPWSPFFSQPDTSNNSGRTETSF